MAQLEEEIEGLKDIETKYSKLEEDYRGKLDGFETYKQETETKLTKATHLIKEKDKMIK